MTPDDKRFTVWVGGSEWNAFYLNQREAHFLAAFAQIAGYDDVAIEQVENPVTPPAYPAAEGGETK